MNIHSSPAYSMSAKNQKPQKMSEVPGPGTYTYETIPNKQHLPAWKIGKQRRSTEIKNQIPGPGTYQIKSNITEKQGVSLKSRHVSEIKNFVPGPGSYDPQFNQFQKSEPSVKLMSDNKPTEFIVNSKNHNPGPGTYDTLNIFLNNRNAIKFGSEKRPSIEGKSKDVPGPGSYYDQKLNGKLLSLEPKFSFGHSNRASQRDFRFPGPGTYEKKTDIQDQIRIKKGYSIPLNKRQLINEGKLSNFIPGPGTYQLNKQLKQNPSYSIGKFSKNNTLQVSKTPSPMDYSYNYSDIKKKKGSMIIGKSQRQPVAIQNNVPGPGYYQNKNIVGTEGPKYSLLSRSKSQQKIFNNLPGPGAYNPKVIFQNDGNVAVDKSQRQPIQGKTKIGPGPGQYVLPNTFLEKGKNIKIGSQKRSSLQNKSITPGPGTYQLPSTISNLPYYTKNN